MGLLRRFLACTKGGTKLLFFRAVWEYVPLLTNLSQVIILNLGITKAICFRLIIFIVAQEIEHLKSLL